MSLELPSDKSNTDDDLSPDDIVDILNQEDDTKDEDPNDKKDKVKEADKTEEDKDDDKDDEDEDLELEDEDKKDEEEIEIEEEDKLLVLPRKKEILKKFPELFKTFPEIEKAIYRDRQFTEVFPDVDTAKDAAEKADTYDLVEEDLAKGDISKIIAAVGDNGQDAINRLADDYLETLGKVSPEARFHVISGVIKTAVEAMATAARDNEDEDLLAAARQLNQFMFQKKNFEPHRRLSEARNSESEKLREERNNWNNQKFDSAKKDAMDKVKNRIQSTIDVNIDKKNSMTPYIKKNAVRDAMNILESTMIQDRSFQRTIDNLWKEARKGNLSDEKIGKVVSAYLFKAKSLLPGVINKAKADALKGIPGKRVDRDRSGRLPINNRDTGNRDRRSSEDVPSGMTTLEKMNHMLKD